MLLYDQNKKYSLSEALSLEKERMNEYRAYERINSKSLESFRKSINFKKFIDEIMPINVLAKKYNAKFIQYEGISNTPCDGVLTLEDNREIKIECTTAINKEIKNLIQVALDNYSSVPAMSNVAAFKELIGYKTKNKKTNNNTSINYENFEPYNLNKVISDTENVIKKKYDNKYKGYYLVVTIDATVSIPSNYEEQICKFWNETNDVFEKLIVLGLNKESEYDIILEI